jgi:hypothetical protein
MRTFSILLILSVILTAGSNVIGQTIISGKNEVSSHQSQKSTELVQLNCTGNEYMKMHSTHQLHFSAVPDNSSVVY